MKKEEIIGRYGKDAYEKMLEQTRVWMNAHPGESAKNARKGGKYYKRLMANRKQELPSKKSIVRHKHRRRWNPFKRIIAPESHIHHNWLNDGTAGYSGVALVEADRHLQGYIDVIQILEGEITLLTEVEIRGDK